MSPELIVLLIVAYAMPVSLLGMQKAIWLPSSPELEALPDEELAARVLRWQELTTLAMFGLSAPFMVAWFFAFRYALHATHARLPEAEFILVGNSVVCILPALFLGLITSSIIVTMYCVAFGSHGYAQYVEKRKRAGKSKTDEVLAWFSIPFMAIFFVLFAGFDGHSARFMEDELIYDPFLGRSEQHYAYSDIERIVYSKKSETRWGQTRDGMRFVVHFKDGRTWGRENSPENYPDRIREVLEFISEKSTVPVEYVPVLRREDL